MAHIVMKNKPYMDKNAVSDLIRYATIDKRNGRYVRYMGAIGANAHNPEEMIREFHIVKKYFEKTEGRQIRHIIVSFDPSKEEGQASPETMAKWAYQIAWFYGSRFQVIYGVHEDSNTPHIHFIINTVSYVDGKMYTSIMNEVKELYDYIDHIIESDSVSANSVKFW